MKLSLLFQKIKLHKILNIIIIHFFCEENLVKFSKNIKIISSCWGVWFQDQPTRMRPEDQSNIDIINTLFVPKPLLL